MGDAAETSKTLHNWMAEPSGQGDEEETLQLSLGLPGGGGGGGGGPVAPASWRMLPAREKEMRSAAAAAVDTSMLSLGYSAPAFSPSSPAGKAKGSPAAATGNALASTNNASQRRSPNTTVIGWPPVRAFRRNLATSSKASLGHHNGKKAAKPEQTTKRAPFVKINMDGIPIGRKIDLNALGSYKELSRSVDKLFRGLLAAQQDPLETATKEASLEEVVISGLLDGTGEYTLVYEDYEGDRVLVGDVPWGMFVSSVKRLRVLKTSDLSSSLTASGRKRTVTEC